MAILKNIAIVGATGNVGRFITSELLKSGHHTLTAITRGAPGAAPTPEGVKAAQTDYSHASLVSALRGQDVLIITLSARAPRDTQAKLIQAAAEAGVRYVVPNGWGGDASHAAWADIFLGIEQRAAEQLVETLGLKWIEFVSGFWYEFSLIGTADRYGFDFKERSVVLFDDGKAKINTTTWEQTGRAVAALFDLDEKVIEERYKNRNVYISSFYVSQRDMLESALRVTDTKESDWKITYEPSVERFASALEKVKAGDNTAFTRALYTRWFYPEKPDAAAMAWQENHKLANEELGLPQEDLDESTRRAIENPAKFLGTYA
ncbi:CipA protein [Scedosporium apiospermum]|uniref:CipA protein n=1 Tax=Pseudallescheria apiosperma TaxID=563466 RepID=A0A084G7E4_PSEDA|nr:CipA protein [Scedosporium apiospermum]KEZ43256.1 CipA protein [Scedosporium apiospermum]